MRYFLYIDRTRMFMYCEVFNVEVKYNSYCDQSHSKAEFSQRPSTWVTSTSAEKNLAELFGFAIYIYSQECTKGGICNVSVSPMQTAQWLLTLILFLISINHLIGKGKNSILGDNRKF